MLYTKTKLEPCTLELKGSLFTQSYDKITKICNVKNEFDLTYKVQNMGNGAFQNAPFPSCLWVYLFKSLKSFKLQFLEFLLMGY